MIGRLKFDEEGIKEILTPVLALYNTYQFYANFTYANVDGVYIEEESVRLRKGLK
jgi:hypothetical protein